jgi:hypothetical protein
MTHTTNLTSQSFLDRIIIYRGRISTTTTTTCRDRTVIREEQQLKA